jgi:hypothetical protein
VEELKKYELSPFVKWAGGKRQLLNELMTRVPLEFNNYLEPFLGGGTLLLNLQPKSALVNDINNQLINVYRAIKSDASELIRAVSDLDLIDTNKEVYYERREAFNQKIHEKELDVEAAALFIWLNKHCFNGLYRVNKSGLFNVPYNNKVSGKSIIPSNLEAMSQYFQENNIEFYNTDFMDITAMAKVGDFVYFDSPYIPESTTANFTDYTKDGFSYEDHLRLANNFKELDKQGVKLMLSNNNVPLVHELYEGYYITEVDVKRAINSKATKRKGKEIIVTNYAPGKD